MKKAVVTDKSPPPPPAKTFEDALPRIAVETSYKGQPDRVTASFGTKVESNSIFFSYSTDVGMFNPKETLAQAKIRCSNYVKKIVIAEKAKIK